jgi:hypothetical protein
LVAVTETGVLLGIFKTTAAARANRGPSKSVPAAELRLAAESTRDLPAVAMAAEACLARSWMAGLATCPPEPVAAKVHWADHLRLSTRPRNLRRSFASLS